MAGPPAELVSQIVELKTEFQFFAVHHPWICLYIPSPEKELENLFLGEQAASRYSANETTFPDPATGRDVTVHIAWGVDSPKDASRQAVVDHVNQLTDRAERLLKRMLDYDSQISPQVRQEIREWEQLKRGYGWVHWMRYATAIRSVYRIENYPQKAATSLWELKEHCRPPKKSRKPGVKLRPRKQRRRKAAAEPATPIPMLLSVSEASKLSGINRGIISRAVDANEIRNNGERGKGKRKIDSADFNRWSLERSNKPERKETEEGIRKRLGKERRGMK